MLLEGALRGRSPRTREGRIGPTAQKREERVKRSEERVKRSEERELPFPWLRMDGGMAMN